MPVDNYCVLYIPDTEKAVVRVIRIPVVRSLNSCAKSA